MMDFLGRSLSFIGGFFVCEKIKIFFQSGKKVCQFGF